MLPLKLTLHNFMSYQNPAPLDFTSFDLACLAGENGAGKSSILEAITFAVWGKTRASSPDSLIHRDKQGMWVDFEFRAGKKNYRIIRKRIRKGRGSSEVDFLVYCDGWESLAGATIKETEEKIAEVVKLPYQIFVNSAYFRQGHADEFTTKPPAQRKEILGKILGLDYYEQLSQKARTIIRDYQNEETVLTISLEEIRESLKQKEIFQKELKETEKALKIEQKNLQDEEKKLRVLEKKKTQFDLTEQKLGLKNEQLTNLETEGRQLVFEIKTIKAELGEIENLLKKKMEIEAGWQKFCQLSKSNEKENLKLLSFSKYREKLAVIRGRQEDLEEKISRLKKIALCPTCLRPLVKKEAEKIIKGLKVAFNKEFALSLEKLKEKIKEVGYDQSKHQAIKKELNRLAGYETGKRKLDLALQSLAEKNKLIKKTRESIFRKRADYSRILKERKVLEKELQKLKPIEQKYLEQGAKARELRDGLSQTQAICGAFQQRLKDLQKQEELYQEKRKKLKAIKEQTNVYKQLAEIFSKNGLQAMIIETILPEIEEEANRLLEKIAAGRMRLTFVTSRERKSGEGEIETLEIKITDSFGTRGYETMSGGEAFRIDLAVRVALSKVLSKSVGAKLQFLAIDEGFGSLDEAGKDDVVEAINGLRNDFEKILVVTHIQELKNLFPARIEVTKNEQGSCLGVVNV